MSDRPFLDPGDETSPEARIRAAEMAAVLRLKDGAVCTLVKRGREAPPLTLILRQGEGPEREVPLTDIAEVLWTPGQPSRSDR